MRESGHERRPEFDIAHERGRTVAQFNRAYNDFFRSFDPVQRFKLGSKTLLSLDFQNKRDKKFIVTSYGIAVPYEFQSLLLQVFQTDRNPEIVPLKLAPQTKKFQLPESQLSGITTRIKNSLNNEVVVSQTIYALNNDGDINRSVDLIELAMPIGKPDEEGKQKTQPIGDIWIGNKWTPFSNGSSPEGYKRIIAGVNNR